MFSNGSTKGINIMWYVLINSRWHKAKRYSYDRVICGNITYLIDSPKVRFKKHD